MPDTARDVTAALVCATGATATFAVAKLAPWCVRASRPASSLYPLNQSD
jgi:hypothetical protein